MKKCSIVTGGASGIGRACVDAFISQGHDVVIADVNAEAGALAAEETGALFIKTDLSQRSECKHLIDETIRNFHKVDILVNNGGYQHISSIEDFPEDKWEDVISILLTAPFLLTKYVWPSMKKQKWGRIVNIASIHSEIASPNKAAYISAKHGLIGLTRTAALEGSELGITVNALSPAYVKTAMVENQIDQQARTRNIPREDVIQKIMLEPAPIKQLIEPDEVANLVSMLCSEQSSSITGANWKIDCGWTIK